MREIMISFGSLRDIQEFVSLASGCGVGLDVRNDRFQVSATSFMGLVALNCRKPLYLIADCSEEELAALKVTFQRFLAE